MTNSETFTLSYDQKDALQQMLSGKNCFVTGGAGVGKSAVAKTFKEKVPDKNIVMLAPTGKVALSNGGSTIHSFFSFGIGVCTTGYLPVLTEQRKSIIAAADIICIDEISLVRADFFEATDRILRECSDTDAPFGGKQMILFGDFYQLPPVVKSGDEEMYIQQEFGGIYAFHTQAWKDAAFACVELTTVHRQSSDLLFMHILNCFRKGDINTAFQYLQGSCDNRGPIEAFNQTATIGTRDLREDVMRLCPTRNEVERINAELERFVAGAPHTLKGIVSGRFQTDDLPVPMNLQLKRGSRVMLLANKPDPKYGGFEYVNGDQGSIVGIDDFQNTITVKLDNAQIVTVTPNRWTNLEYESKECPETGKIELFEQETGSYVQYPICVARAISFHKSQGQTYDKVRIEMGNGMFCPGMLYVALSRSRTLGGLTISRKLHYSDLFVDPEVVKFYKAINHSCDNNHHQKIINF